MRKLFFAVILLIGTICISNCSYDDSNDLDIITPNDSLDSKYEIQKY